MLYAMGRARPFPLPEKGGESMGFIARRLRFRRKSPILRPKEEKCPVPSRRREAPGWRLLDVQMALEFWRRSNGLR